MHYTDEQQNDLADGYVSAHSDMRDLTLECLREADTTDVAASKEHLCHGAARRFGVMGRAMQSIFELFPVDTDRPLPMESLHDVQIKLHTFVMNVYGVFENFTWAFVLRHNLLPTIGRPVSVSMFKEATRKHLPLAVADHLSSDAMTQWHTDYLKNYRDALAHRYHCIGLRAWSRSAPSGSHPSGHSLPLDAGIPIFVPPPERPLDSRGHWE
jgi:hypothetical protein